MTMSDDLTITMTTMTMTTMTMTMSGMIYVGISLFVVPVIGNFYNKLSEHTFFLVNSNYP